MLNITEKINPPIFLYYEFDNFFLNHRALVKSKIWAQLTGEENIVNYFQLKFLINLY